MTHYAEERISNPTRYFKTPEVVLSDDKLSFEEKEKVLRSMADDADQLMDATAEGMEGNKHAYSAEDLQSALKELEKVKDAKEASESGAQVRGRRFKNIVVVTTVNQELNREITDAAMDLSEHSGGTVSLLNVVPTDLDGAGPATAVSMTSGGPIVTTDHTDIVKDRTNLLSELREETGAGEELAIAVRSGPVEEAIMRYATDICADVIVVGSPNRSWLERLFAPSVARSVTRAATCPVLVVPEPEHADAE
ncbi:MULTISPECIES: universal stress protein [unclassified Roseovarius]|uniref:universal stress protein n=1 Tax=unclassified Roseovarius TaxID=2614913 RepID=UPI00273EBB67|nr:MULTISPECIES: universal stress protein [unclassified Roseovarius]